MTALFIASHREGKVTVYTSRRTGRQYTVKPSDTSDGWYIEGADNLLMYLDGINRSAVMQLIELSDVAHAS